jgi:hypothetical protein
MLRHASFLGLLFASLAAVGCTHTRALSKDMEDMNAKYCANVPDADRNSSRPAAPSSNRYI